MHRAVDPETLTFGRARREDLDALVRIHTAAFPDDRDREVRYANFFENSHGGPERLFVLRCGENAVAHAFLFRLRGAVAGQLVELGGVASVGVAPEFRGEGVGARLLRCLHEEAHREGLLGTVLYAFRQAFYRRFGYGRTGLRAIVDAHPASFETGPSDAVVRCAYGPADRAIVARLFEQNLLSGSLGHARSERVWDRLAAAQGREVLLAERNGKAVGYMWCDRACSEPHAPVRLRIGELVAEDDDAERALLRWIQRQRDQVERVVWELPAADLERLDLVDPDRHRPGTAAVEHALGTLALGPMVRLPDNLEGFLRRRRWPVDASVRLGVDGPDGRRAEAWALKVDRGSAEVEALAHDAHVDLSADRVDLASLLLGGVPLGSLRRVRRAAGETGVDPDAFFALPPTRVYDGF